MKDSIRSQFPMLSRKMNGKPFVYLDSAATTHKPLSVIETMRKFYAEEYATVHRSVYEFAGVATDRYHAVREKVRGFINAKSSDEIVFTKGTTEAINLVAHSFGRQLLEPGDEIIVTELEHHSNYVPWQALCQEKGLSLKCVRINERAELKMEQFDELLTERTRLVCVGHVANSTGTINPIREIIAKAHAKGAKVLIDGAQAIAHLPVDVQDLDADFYAFSGHKMYGPTGIGVLYGKRDLLERMPPYQYGGDMIESVTLDEVSFAPPPMRFEAGTPGIAAVMGLGAAIDFIESIGREQIAKFDHELLGYATARLKEIEGLRLIGEASHKGGIISFVLDDIHALDMGTLLDLRGVAVRTGQLCAQPTLECFNVPSLIRISFAVHTTYEEIDIFVDALQGAMLVLRPAILT